MLKISTHGVVFRGAFIALLGAFPCGAHAQSGRSDPQHLAEIQHPSAATHFERGYASAQRGDYAAAAVEFARAYELEPKTSVLFNLGQAYAASGQPIAAYDTLEQYLRLEQQRANPERERRARELMEIAASRIGRVWIEVEPEGAQVGIDGRTIGTSPLERFERLTEGSHALVVNAPGYLSRAVSVNVRPSVDSQIFVRLEPAAPEVPGLLVLQCAVPDVQVSIDGIARGTIPGRGFVPLPPGRHSIVVRRTGYVTESGTVDVTAGQTQSYACKGELYPRLDRSSSGTLSVALPPALESTIMFVDGRVAPGGSLLLPSGRHVVEVRAPNHEPWVREVTLAPGSTVHLSANPSPTQEFREAAFARRDSRQFWSKVALGTGVGLAATAATLSFITAEKHDDWLEERDALEGENLADNEVASRFRSHAGEALEIERLQSATVGVVVLGAGSLALSAYLWFSAGEVPGGEHLSAHVGADGGQVFWTASF